MTPAELQSLRNLPTFPAAAASLIAAVGIEAAAALITEWPGQRFPVPARPGGGTRQGAVNWACLVEVTGEAAATVIVRHWGGLVLYVPSCSMAMCLRRHDDVRQMFDKLTRTGMSSRQAVFDIGLKFQLSYRAVEKIIGRPDSPAALPGQLNLFI
jgi:hypothetical protein